MTSITDNGKLEMALSYFILIIIKAYTENLIFQPIVGENPSTGVHSIAVFKSK